jgi:pimeloyl-ACP methyl ester carboxylesterase
MRFKNLIVAVLIVVAKACSRPQERRPDAWTDPSPHRSEYVSVNGVRLNYLDWGGTEPTLVLIHGWADSPHVFDDLAASLRHRAHLIAYARRGHGRSDAPPGPYDEAMLVEDLRQLLDKLGIKRSILLGWSMGGNEITDFAGRFPDRVSGLIYLEAGYDWSDSSFNNDEASKFESEFGSIFDPVPAADLASLDVYRTYIRRMWYGKDTPWTPGLEAELRDVVRIQANGRIQPVPYGAALEAFSSLGKASRDYRSVRAPALALFASSFFPIDPSDPAVMRRSQAWEDRVMAAFRRASIERLRRELPHAEIKDFPNTNHMSIAVLNRSAVEAAILEFLGQIANQ